MGESFVVVLKPQANRLRLLVKLAISSSDEVCSTNSSGLDDALVRDPACVDGFDTSSSLVRKISNFRFNERSSIASGVKRSIRFLALVVEDLERRPRRRESVERDLKTSSHCLSDNSRRFTARVGDEADDSFELRRTGVLDRVAADAVVAFEGWK